MEKVLTVSVAAYNVESYIRKTLESMTDSAVIDELEIFVVDDGGQDDTLAIAQEYADKYPQSVFCVHKENGGYGSTVNYSIRHAHGKYFRLLDGDDWFDSEELSKFVRILKTAQEDMVVTRFTRVFEENGHREVRDESRGIPFETCRFDELDPVDWFTMHAVTYRTEILQAHDIVLTEHCFYTDQEYDLLPLRWVETVRFAPCSVYCYRIGRGEQSVSPAGVEKHYREQTRVLKRVYGIYTQAINQPETKKERYIQKYLVKRTSLQIWNYLMISKSKEHKQELKEFMSFLKKEQPRLHGEVLRRSKRLRALVCTNYVLYGYLHAYRLKRYVYKSAPTPKKAKN